MLRLEEMFLGISSTPSKLIHTPPRSYVGCSLDVQCGYMESWSNGASRLLLRRNAFEYGAQIWDLLEGKPLCRGFDPRRNKYTSRAHHAQLIGLLGPPPKQLLDRGEHAHRYFHPNGELH
jgi:hypothetical protein